MLWHLVIDAEKNEQLSTSITVEAESWFLALREGLDKHGLDGNMLANLSCKMAPDNSVRVTDIITRKVYLLRPVSAVEERETRPGAGEAPTAEARSVTAETPIEAALETAVSVHGAEIGPASSGAGKAEVPAMDQEESAPEQGSVPEHVVFYSRDEQPHGEGEIFYRERLIAVSPELSKEAALGLARHYYRTLRELHTPEGTQLYITVHVYDHEFTSRAQRPAVVALTWKAWRPEAPDILFPLSGEEGATHSKRPAPKEAAKRRPTRAHAGRARDSLPDTGKPDTARSRQAQPYGQGSAGASAKLGMDDGMVAAFERMQGMYALRDHDRAAAFALSVARELIPCEAGSSMLISPGKYELYVAAAEGPTAGERLGERLSLSHGIVGYAARSSIVVSVDDLATDARFESPLDRETGYATGSVLCAPMQFEGATVGAIELVNSANAGGFTEGEGHILSYVATSLAEYLCTSLPSREADFTNQDFLSPLIKKKATPKKALAQKPGEKKAKGGASAGSRTAPAKKAKAGGKTAAAEKQKGRAPTEPKKKRAVKSDKP